MRKIKGGIFIVSAPSGAGKTTLCNKLTDVLKDIRHSVSYTTRAPRKDEVKDRDYTFIDEAEFHAMTKAGEFVEWAKVHGNFYGTSRRRLEEMRAQGIDVILDIDTQGAGQLRRTYAGGIYIFIMPPSLEALKSRLENRRNNPPEEIALRMKRALKEIREYKKYDYVIINNVFDEALTELKSIVVAERVKTDRLDPKWIKNFFKEEENI